MKIISEIKLKTKSLKDKRKNILKLIKCFEGKLEPDCCFTCTRHNIFNSLDNTSKHIWMVDLDGEYLILTKQIDIVGKSILELRGNKWSF